MKLYFPALLFADLRGLKKFMKFPKVELVDWSFFLMGASPSEPDAASSKVGCRLILVDSLDVTAFQILHP
jgi:hypothetical protein